MKTVDEVTLVAGQELSPPPTAPDGSWEVYLFPNTGLLGYRYPIDGIGTIISEQIGAAVNRPDRVYQPGIDMPDGSAIVNDGDGQPTILEDPYLDGLEYSVHVRGLEYAIKGQEWQNDVAGGGFRWTDGRIFEDGMVVTVSFKPQISNVLVAPDAVGRFTSGMQEITADTVLGPSFQRKLLLLNSATTTLSVTLDATYPENVICAMITGVGTQKQTTISAPAGQDVYFNGIKSSFFLGQSEYCYMVRIGTRWYVTQISDGWQRVGQVVMGGIPSANVISANGQTLQRAEVPRLDAYLDALNAALPGSVITVGAWATDSTKWARDATTIRAPKLAGWFPRFLDLGAGKDTDRGAAGNIVGSTQANQNKAHTHSSADYNQLLKNDGTNTITVRDNTFGEPNLGSSQQMLSEGGIESRPENVGLPALIYI
ncbi:hypothetical protein [Chitinophaga sp.]|uniref:hypothetical protein n=1 Tax=Chitinophaga sp. TaxID=1869181 RepID=UPI0031CE013A